MGLRTYTTHMIVFKQASEGMHAFMAMHTRKSFKIHWEQYKNTVETAQKYTGNSTKIHWKQHKNTLGTAQKHTGNSTKIYWEQYKNTPGTVQKYTG